MAVGENPLKFLLLTHFAPCMPKIRDWVEKRRNGTTFVKSNCPTQEYMTGPLFHRTYYHANSILEAWLIVAKPTSLLQSLFQALLSQSILPC